MHHPAAVAEAKPSTDERGRRHDVATQQHVAVVDAARLDLVADERNEKARLADGIARHAGAGLATALDHAAAGQFLERAVDGGAGGAELGGQRFLAGDERTRFPHAKRNAACKFVADSLERGLSARRHQSRFPIAASVAR